MFKRQRDFNIISGQVANKFITQRSKSCVSQLQNYKKTTQLNTKPHKLGIARDQKQFQYSYFDSLNNSTLPRIQTQPQIKKSQSYQNHTMLNYVSTGYNIINHTNQIETAKIIDKKMFLSKMPQVFKKSPLTQHIHRARKYAPNYHDNYETRTDNHEFNKKVGLCSDICGVEKTYGQSKYFRKFK